MKLKYIITDEVYPTVTGLYFNHSDIKTPGEVTSAGFCSIKEVETPSDRMDITSFTMFVVDVWGKSISLNVESKPTDSKVLERMFNSR